MLHKNGLLFFTDISPTNPMEFLDGDLVSCGPLWAVFNKFNEPLSQIRLPRACLSPDGWESMNVGLPLKLLKKRFIVAVGESAHSHAKGMCVFNCGTSIYVSFSSLKIKLNNKKNKKKKEQQHTCAGSKICGS